MLLNHKLNAELHTFLLLGQLLDKIHFNRLLTEEESQVVRTIAKQIAKDLCSGKYVCVEKDDPIV